ncbi:Maf family nucleotide pyrophosphatase [Flavobacteriaceae bacterium F08102]|nr:Maf family nucleotide pyrophosphatase [Flavobacteriaceae bacterium F08102]
MLNEKLNKYSLILGSESPRRKHFLEALKLDFKTIRIDAEEVYPKYLHGNEITNYLAELKSEAYPAELADQELLITADTIVRCNGQILGKPTDLDEAKSMLRFMSGHIHEVITSVCLRTNEKMKVFSDTTDVHFKELTDEEINYYVETYSPLDKAGAYGIQEWIGYIGVLKIEGSFFTVMGFPVHKFYKEMMEF